MTRFSPYSLRARLVLLVLLAVLPPLGLTVYSGLEHRRTAAAAAQNRALEWARLIAGEQEQVLESARELLLAMAHFRAVRERDAEVCTERLGDVLKRLPFYTNLGAARPDGVVFCSGRPLRGRVSFADRSWFQRTLETRAFTVSEYLVGRITKEPLLSLSVPAVDEAGVLRAVVFGGLDLTWLQGLIARLKPAGGEEVLFLDRHGTVLARYPEGEQWIGKAVPELPLVKLILARGTGTAEAPGLAGTPRLYAFTPLGEARGVVAYAAVGIPRDVVFADANRGLARNLIGLSLVAILAAAVAWVGGDRFLLRRVNALVRPRSGWRPGS